MSSNTWHHHIFTSSQAETENSLDFVVHDLHDVRLGFFVVAIQTTISFEKTASVKHIIREAIDRFATTAKPLTVTEHLEKLFAHINKHIREVFAPDDYRDTHIGIVHYRAGEIQFSMHGDFKLLLIRKSRLFDIIKMTYGLSPHSFDKMFSRMYSGTIKPHDDLLLTSAETWHCLDHDKLPEIISKLPLESAIGFIENYYPPHTQYRLGGVIVKFSERPEETSQPQRTKASLSPSESISELLETEDATSAWLSPSLSQRVKKGWQALAGIIRERKLPKKPEERKGRLQREERDASKTYIAYAQKTSKGVWSITKSIFNGIAYVITAGIGLLASAKRTRNTKSYSKVLAKKAPSEKGPRKTTRKKASITKRFGYTLDRIKRQYRKWPKSTKWLLLAALILILLFAQSITFMNKRQQTRQADTYFTALVTDISELHTQADQAIIFRDYARARSLLIDANNLIAELPTAGEEQTIQKDTLRDENEKQLSRANRLTVIPAPFELSNVSSALSGLPEFLSVIQNEVFVADSKKVLAIDSQTGRQRVLAIGSETTVQAILPESDASDASLLVLHDNNVIGRYDEATQDLITMNTSFDVGPDVLADVAIFNKRLYRLDIQNNQIWRHLRSASSFQSANAWLDLPTDLSQTRSLAVDGDLYVLTADQGIVQFNKGVRTDWSSEVLSQPITGATQIVTTDDSDYLYVLDPPNNRFVIFDKEGFFLQQFTSPELDSLKRMAIVEGETNNTAYLLNGSSIYVIQFQIDG